MIAGQGMGRVRIELTTIACGNTTGFRGHATLPASSAASDLARLSSAASFGNVTVRRGLPCLSRSRHSSRRDLNSLAICAAPVRRLPLRDHLAQECERRGDELTAGLGHSRSPGKPLRLPLLPLLLRLVHRGVRFRAKEHFETALQLLHPGGERDLLRL
jgi:hypothetical protein